MATKLSEKQQKKRKRPGNIDDLERIGDMEVSGGKTPLLTPLVPDQERSLRGATIHKIAPDGNCLFGAIADQLGRDPNCECHPCSSLYPAPPAKRRRRRSRSTETVRYQIAREIGEHPGRYTAALEASRCYAECKQNVVAYVEKMKVPCSNASEVQWGGAAELDAAAALFERNIVVLSPDCKTIYRTHLAPTATSSRPAYITYSGDHYDSVVVNGHNHKKEGSLLGRPIHRSRGRGSRLTGTVPVEGREAEAPDSVLGSDDTPLDDSEWCNDWRKRFSEVRATQAPTKAPTETPAPAPAVARLTDEKTTQSWLQCDTCSKWRKCTYEELAKYKAQTWHCAHNTDEGHRACEDEQEPSDDEYVQGEQEFDDDDEYVPATTTSSSISTTNTDKGSGR